MSTQLVPTHSPEEHEGSNNPASTPPRYACFGTFHLDLKREELFKDGTRVKLQGKVYQALLALLQKPGEIVTREELRMQLWPSDTHVNYDANVNTTVNKLRQVLGDSPDQPAFVDTIPRKGYSFVAKVEYVDRPVAPQAPKPAGLSSVTAPRTTPRTTPPTKIVERTESTASYFRAALTSRWFTTAVVTLVIASMLFGAALVLYAHR
jgi:DNA-binding winged helix-turn-helix (wHTH) protein